MLATSEKQSLWQYFQYVHKSRYCHLYGNNLEEHGEMRDSPFLFLPAEKDYNRVAIYCLGFLYY